MFDNFSGLLTLIVFLPAFGALLIALFGRTPLGVRTIALLVLGWDLARALVAWVVYMRGADDALLVDRIGGYGSDAWIPGVNAAFSLALDGLSIPLVVLTALLGVVGVLASA